MLIKLAELKEAMVAAGYIQVFRNNLVLTGKFIEDLKEEDAKLELEPQPVKDPILDLPHSELFRKFIKDANIPTKSNTDTGFYWCNRYSDEAARKFKKACKTEASYDLMVLAAKAYYGKGENKYKKTIANFILEKVYISFIEDLSAAPQRTIHNRPSI